MTPTSKKTHVSPEVGVFGRQEQDEQNTIEDYLDIIVLLNGDAVITYVSPSVTPVLGYMPEEIVGSCILCLVHSDHLATMQRLVSEMKQAPG